MDAIHHDLTVACNQRAAFDLFTTGMGTWWDPRYSPDAATYDGIELDPRVGGAIALRHGEHTFAFGRVLVWEPGSHYSQSLWLAMSAAHPSRLDARFDAVDGVEGACRVRVSHGGWTSDNQAARAKYGDWPCLLGRFAEAAARLPHVDPS